MSRASAVWPRAGAALLVATTIALSIALTLSLRAVLPLPFLSEDWNHLEAARALPTLGAALDPAREPLRPVQHLLFFALSRADDPSPALARMPALLAHLVSAVLVASLAARALRADPATARAAGGAAAVAALLFLAFPNVKSLAWPAAVGGPVRACFALGALTAFAARERRPGAANAVAFVGCALAALLAHESGVLVPAFAALWVLAAADGAGDLLRRARGLARDPAFLAAALLALGWAAALALRPQRHHAVRELAALPANGAKALFALFPEVLRVPLIDGLRGEHGTAALAVSAAALLAVALAWGRLCARGSRTTRFAALAIGLELALPAATTGFVQRYAYLASALAALAIAAAIGRSATAPADPAARAPLAWLAAAALALAWCYDQTLDAYDYAAAGRVHREVIATARAARAEAAPGTRIALLDLPDMGGAERDLPLFNWGSRQAFAAHGLDGPWSWWRTRPYATGTDVEPVDQAAIEAARAQGVVVLAFERRGREGVLRPR